MRAGSAHSESRGDTVSRMPPDVTDLRSFGEDTHPAVERLLVDGYRTMAPTARLTCAAEMLDALRLALAASLRSDRGDVLADREVELLVAERLYGRPFVDAIRRAEASR